MVNKNINLYKFGGRIKAALGPFALKNGSLKENFEYLHYKTLKNVVVKEHLNKVSNNGTKNAILRALSMRLLKTDQGLWHF